MKTLLIFPLLFFCSFSFSQSQDNVSKKEQIVLDNEKLKVVEFVSQPKGDVCGKGTHKHEPHLTVFLTDANLTLTADGKTQDVSINSGTSMWFDAGTHAVINKGDKPTKMHLVYLKK